MSIVTCPGCGKRGKFPPHFVGKPIKCRACGSRFTAAADADNLPEVPGPPGPPAFDLQTPASKQEVLEPLEADQPADCGINLAQPADCGIDLEKKPVIGHQTFQTYLSAINAYMAAKGVQPGDELIPIDDPAPPPGRTRHLIAAALLACVAMAAGAVLVALFGPRHSVVESQTPVGVAPNETKAEPIFVSVEKPPEEARPKPAEQLTPEELFAKASPSVVRVVARNANSLSLGSGFLVSSDGLVVTNHHVIKKAQSGAVYFGSGSKVSILGVVALDSGGDLAILKIAVGDIPELPLAPELPRVGSRVFAIGSPTPEDALANYQNSLSDGLVSGCRANKDLGGVVIQTTAPFSKGSSGGPLLCADGRVVGVTTWSEGVGGIHLAVPASRVVSLLADRGPLQPLPGAVENVTAKPTPPSETTPPSGSSSQPSPVPSQSVPVVKAEADIPKTIQRLMDLTNQARYRQNHLSLQGNAMLHWVAHLHSANMSKQHRCAQILQDGWTPSQRLTAAGYYHVLHGQHVDYRQELDADAIFDDWMQSPVYRAGILFRYEEMGIGIVQSPRGGYFITQMFGTRPRW